MGEVHIPRTAGPAVQDFAGSNQLKAEVALLSDIATKEGQLAARAHDFLKYNN